MGSAFRTGRIRNDSGLHSRNSQLDAVHTGAGRNVERLAIFVAPCHIAHGLGDFDCAEVFPFRRNNPNAAGAGAVEGSFFVHTDAVWPPTATTTSWPLGFR